MRRIPLAAALVVALLTPGAAGEQGQAAFEATAFVPLWGDVLVEDAEGTLYQRADSAAAFEARAPRMTVTVVTVVSNESGEERSEQAYEFTDAALVLLPEAEAAISKPRADDGAVSAGVGWSLRFDDPRIPPQDVQPGGEAPEPAAVLVGAPFLPPSDSSEAKTECDLFECRAVVEGTTVGAGDANWSLLPGVPGTLDGFLSLTLTRGQLRVSGQEGERVFATDFHEETRYEGGVDVPVVGNVGGTPKRTWVFNLTFVHAEDAHATIPPNEGDTVRTSFLASDLVVGVLGTLYLHEATGAIRVGEEQHRLERQDAVVGGSITLTPGNPERGAAMAMVAEPAAPAGSAGPADPERPVPPTRPYPGSSYATYRMPRAPFALEGDITYLRIAEQEGKEFASAAIAAGGIAGLGALLVALTPAAKFALSKLFVLPLYTRLRKPEVLDHARREALLNAIREEPGAHTTDLASRLKIGWGSLVYHLSVLEREKLVSSCREGRHRRFFPVGDVSPAMRMPLALLRNTHAARVLEVIRRQPGLAQKHVSRQAGLSPSTINWHVERLMDAGLVWKKQAGRNVEYYPSDLLQELDRDREPPEGPGFAG